MDTSDGQKVDRLGRRTGPRRRYTVAEKLQILQETRGAGSSVAQVAMAHGINANVIFGWRRLAQRGLLREGQTGDAALLPVKVHSPTLLPSQKASAPSRQPVSVRKSGCIEIRLPGGIQVHLHGVVDLGLLKRVMQTLAPR